jgi:hypothetical protein
MVVGSPGRSKEVTTDDGFTYPVRKSSRKQQLASTKNAIGNALETTEENENEYQDDCEEDDEIEENGNIHIYNIRLNSTLPKRVQAHKPLWILKELLQHLKKADPEAGFLTEIATGEEELDSKTTRAITLKNKLSDPNTIVESDPAKGDTIVKKYLHELKLVQNNQRMLAIISIASKEQWHTHRKRGTDLFKWMTEHSIYLETYTMQTLEVKVAGLFTRVHAVSKSNGTFKQLLLQECTGLRESKIPFVIRASEFKANSEPEATHRSMVFTVSCAEADVVKIQNHLDLYKKKEGHQKCFFTLREWLGFTDSTKVNVLRQNNDWTKCYRRITLSGVKDLSTVMSVQDAAAPGGVVRMTIEEFLLQATHHDSSFPLFKYLGGYPTEAHPYAEFYTPVNNSNARQRADAATRWIQNAASILLQGISDERHRMSTFTIATLQATQKEYSKPALAIPKEIEVTFTEMRFDDDEDVEATNPGRYDSPGKSRNPGTGSPPKKKNRNSKRKQPLEIYGLFPNGASQDILLLGNSGRQNVGRGNKRRIYSCRQHSVRK